MTDLVEQPASPPAAPAKDRADNPAFKVVAIGDGAAGKTNFLAMLYQHLSSPEADPPRPWTASCGPNPGW
ncbi:hypothetical protein [Streptosporangium sp. V21-05]|uniref:hypothetical protein n=1 Tax=Streptosporangium sp. V21-05 TaxID=3446115 RepID=UPI003F53D58A